MAQDISHCVNQPLARIDMKKLCMYVSTIRDEVKCMYFLTFCMCCCMVVFALVFTQPKTPPDCCK